MRVRRGATRFVLIFSKVVVKLPNPQEWRLFLSGILANLQERTWGNYSPRLARVIWSDPLGFVLVMERARLPGNFHREHLLNCEGLFDGLPVGDWKVENFGFIGRRLVCIDYGS